MTAVWRLAVFIVLALAGLTFVSSAKASTAACLGVTSCGTNVNPADNLAWNVLNGTATLNNALVAGANTANQSSDFIRTQPVSGKFRYQYAPNGVGSVYCVSDPQKKDYNSNPDTLVLRVCNTGNWQLFKVVGSTLVGVASNLPVKDNGNAVPLTGTSGAITAWTWTDATSNGQLTAPAGYSTKLLEDQFTGTTLDSSKWVTYMGDRGIRWDNQGALPSPYSGANQPGSSGVALFAPSQVSVNNGLTFTAQRNTNQYASLYPWISGTINTEGKFTLPTTSAWFVQAKIKMPDASQGMWPAMWFLCGVSCTPENELDGWEGGFKELPGIPANRTAHYDYFSNAGEKAAEVDIGTDVSTAYHVYGVEFVPNQFIKYYFDGQVIFTVSAGAGVSIPAEPYEIMLNLQVAADSTSGWHTIPNANTPATNMQVSEVQAYSP